MVAAWLHRHGRDAGASRSRHTGKHLMRSFLFAVFSASSLLATPALADGVPGSTGVSVRAGTLGLGVELSHSLPVLNLTGRLAWNGYDYGHDDTVDGIDYDLDLGLRSVSAMLDWRPWGRVTHLTVGVLYNGNEIDARSRAAAEYRVGGTTFDATQVGTLTGTVGFDEIAPYAGIGWNIPVAPKTALSLDVGVVFQGAPVLELRADGPLASDPVFQAELAREQASFQQDIEDYEYYPVLSLGVRRKF